MSEVDSLFEPNGKSDMRLDYPELAEVPEFEELSSTEVRLCWYIGNRTSPLVKNIRDKGKRVKSALEKCYTGASRERQDYKDMLEGNFPHKILVGIEKMASYNPSFRLKAKLLDEWMFDKIQSLVMKDEVKINMMDIDDEKKYTSMMLEVSKSMPDMIGRMEQGYGVKKKKIEKEVQVMSSVGNIRERLD
jgi:hypothetical protein